MVDCGLQFSAMFGNHFFNMELYSCLAFIGGLGVRNFPKFRDARGCILSVAYQNGKKRTMLVPVCYWNKVCCQSFFFCLVPKWDDRCQNPDVGVSFCSWPPVIPTETATEFKFKLGLVEQNLVKSFRPHLQNWIWFCKVCPFRCKFGFCEKL